MATEELDVSTVLEELALLAELKVLLAADGGEAPVLGDNDLLATGELVLRAAEGLESGSTVGVTGADGQNDLTNVHTGDETLGLTEGTTHTGLQTIGTSARQHLVDTDDVEGVDADAEVETFLTGDLDKVLVGANTGGLESLGGQLLVLVGNQVDAHGEVIHVGLLTTKIEDTNLRVGNTTVEPGLGVRLVLAVAVTSRGTTGHFECWKGGDGTSCELGIG